MRATPEIVAQGLTADGEINKNKLKIVVDIADDTCIIEA